MRLLSRPRRGKDAERLAEFLRELHVDAHQEGGIVTVETGVTQAADAAILYARSWSRIAWRSRGHR
jgi:hypothetical protein